LSADCLIEAIRRKKSPTVVGLDHQPEHIPPEIARKAVSEHGESLEALAAAYEEMNRVLIDALHELVPAVKPQMAFYEALGAAGVRAFERTVDCAKAHGLFVIADGKRGDIGSSAKGYSSAFLGRVAFGAAKLPVFDVDALTVNPYLGSDNLEPFVQDCREYGKMVFVLCKTSNPSSSEIQELMVGDRPLYRVVADQVFRAGQALRGEYGYSGLGIVAGATQPKAIRF